MFRTIITSAALGLSALTALVPGTASAQNYGGWNARRYSDSGYDDRYRGYNDYDRRDSYRARERWLERRRWEQEARRRYWERQRFEHARERRDWDGYGRNW